MTSKSKKDVFRFITFRSPSSLSTDQQSLGFFSMPESDPILDRSSGNTLRTASEPSEILTTIKDVQNVSANMWNFNIWLQEHKNNLTLDEMDDLDPALLPRALTDTQSKLLWDNLYYSIQEHLDQNVRQAMVQMLSANNFRVNYQIAGTDSKLRRLAKAIAVVPSDLFSSEPTTSIEIESPSSTNKNHLSQLKARLELNKIPSLQTILDELECYENRYNSDANEAMKQAQDEYADDIQPIIDAYIAAHPLDPTQSLENQLPEDLVPEFNFDFSRPFSDEYASDKLSEETREYVRKNCLANEEVSTVRDHLVKQIDELTRKAAKAQRKITRRAVLGGVPVRLDTDNFLNFILLPVSTDAVDGYAKVAGNKFNFQFLLDTDASNLFLSNANFVVTTDEETFTEEEPLLTSSENNGILAQLYINSPVTLSANTKYKFQGNFTLSNGKSYKILRSGYGNILPLTGAATLINSNIDIENCGITKVGVAEFRRVEQELCCYIPGEVSHIENILAKEYKERSTRNLTRMDSEIITTSEREMEELSDTSTTTKHELSSEIAEVLQKDRSSNIGFSAGVNGSIGKTYEFSAGAYGDFSTGLSTSQSNVLAKDYAEEVTRRALERIVQRTTTQRTSRIIREFEENNKHGFDNRNGESNVTGVYRWVDKV